MGIGIGIAAMLYFMNIISNLTSDLEFIKYVTPFGYTESGDIISNGRLNGVYVAIGIAISAACVTLAFLKYKKKDIF